MLYTVKYYLGKENLPEKIVDLAYIVLHPVRREIVELLRKSKSPAYIAQISREIRINEKLTAFHLATLLSYGLVEGKWGTTKTGKGGERAVKYYSLSKKAEEVLEATGKWLETKA